MLPTVSIDCFFMGPSGQKEAQGVFPILAEKSHESRMKFALGVVDSTTRRLVADLDWLGLRRLAFKSDQKKNRRFWFSSRRSIVDVHSGICDGREFG